MEEKVYQTTEKLVSVIMNRGTHVPNQQVAQKKNIRNTLSYLLCAISWVEP